MSPIDIVVLVVLVVLAGVTVRFLRPLLWRWPFYCRRARPLRLFVLVVMLGAVFVSVTVWPVLVFRFVPPPVTSFMAQRAVPCRGVSYRWVSWKRMSPHAPIAFVAAEDQRFPHHRGFDVEAIREAWDEAARGKRQRGASTISQQVAKNLFLWGGRSWVRKGLEVWWTALLEATWPKRRILEVYANTAQLGRCTFGVGAAAREFFGKDASKMTPSESALLAAVLPNPTRFRVDAPSGHVRERQAWIARQVRNLGGASYLDSPPPERGKQ